MKGARFKMAAPLRRPDFGLLWSGLTISLIGDGIFFVALPLQVFAITDDPAALTLVLASWTLPSVLLIVWGGWLSDRFERRTMLGVGNALQGLAIAGIGLLALGDSMSLWSIAWLAALYGAGEAIFGPAFGSIVPDLVPQDQLVEANSLDNFSRPFALRVAGPALGGIIVANFGLARAFLVDAATFLIAGIAFAMIRARRGRRVEQGLARAELVAGFRFVRTKAWLWGGLLSSAIGLLAFYGPWQALVPYVITHGLGGDEGALATVLAVGGIGALLASVLIGQLSLPRRYLTALYVSLSGGTLMLVGFGVADRLWQAVAASFVMGGLFTTGIIIWNTTMHRLVPSDILGRVSGVDWMVSTSLIPVSLLLTAPISRIVGPRATLVGAGLIGAVGIASFLLAPEVRAPEGEKLPVSA
jgi:predicted MFS family arabinose efflux permease